MPVLALADTHLYYEDTGQGPAAIFVSGGALDATYWLPLVEILSDRYRCITFDNRGVGRSDKPSRPYTIQRFAQDVMELAQALELRPYHLVGHSMGGYIAQVVGSQDPDCSSLTLIGTAPEPPAEAVYLMELRKTLRKRLDPELFTATTASWMFGSETFRNNMGFIDDYIERSSASASPQPDHLYEAHMDACIEFTNESFVSKISVPSLVLVGAGDLITPPSCSDKLDQQLQTATKKVIDGAGHMVHLEKPHVVAEEMLRFWSVLGTTAVS